MAARYRTIPLGLALTTALALTGPARAQPQAQPAEPRAAGPQQGHVAEADQALARGDMQAYHRALLKAPQSLPPALRQILEAGQENARTTEARAGLEPPPQTAEAAQADGPSRERMARRQTSAGASAQDRAQDRQRTRQSNRTVTNVPEQYRQEQGRVVEVRPVRVRGVRTPNYLAVVETMPGRRLVVDIGQAIRGAEIRPGAPIVARGKIVRLGNRGALLMADAIQIGNRIYEVDRPAFIRTR